jgi:Bax protein
LITIIAIRFSRTGMTAKQQRKGKGKYGLDCFDSRLDSVEGYMLNINITTNYKNISVLRNQLR